MNVECPKCKKRYEVSEAYAGKPLQCDCGEVFNFVIPIAAVDKGPQSRPLSKGTRIASAVASAAMFFLAFYCFYMLDKLTNSTNNAAKLPYFFGTFIGLGLGGLTLADVIRNKVPIHSRRTNGLVIVLFLLGVLPGILYWMITEKGRVK